MVKCHCIFENNSSQSCHELLPAYLFDSIKLLLWQMSPLFACLSYVAPCYKLWQNFQKNSYYLQLFIVAQKVLTPTWGSPAVAHL